MPLPEVAKTFSATEIGKLLGISSNKVGIIANRNNLKTPEYGVEVMDKAKGHSKDVPSFRYFENVIPVLKALLEQTNPA